MGKFDKTYIYPAEILLRNRRIPHRKFKEHKCNEDASQHIKIARSAATTEEKTTD